MKSTNKISGKPWIVEKIKSSGGQTYCWTPNSRQEVLTAFEAGVEYAMCDYPSQARSFIFSQAS